MRHHSEVKSIESLRSAKVQLVRAAWIGRVERVGVHRSCSARLGINGNNYDAKVVEDEVANEPTLQLSMLTCFE
jgi:hypothetical protein